MLKNIFNIQIKSSGLFKLFFSYLDSASAYKKVSKKWQISVKRVISLVVLISVVFFLNVFSRSNCDKKATVDSFEKHPSEKQKNDELYDLKEESLNGFLNWINKISEAREREELFKSLQFQLEHSMAKMSSLLRL